MSREYQCRSSSFSFSPRLTFLRSRSICRILQANPNTIGTKAVTTEHLGTRTTTDGREQRIYRDGAHKEKTQLDKKIVSAGREGFQRPSPRRKQPKKHTWPSPLLLLLPLPPAMLAYRDLARRKKAWNNPPCHYRSPRKGRGRGMKLHRGSSDFRALPPERRSRIKTTQKMARKKEKEKPIVFKKERLP